MKNRNRLIGVVWFLGFALVGGWLQGAAPPRVLSGTQALTLEGDLASRLVDGVDRFLLGKLQASVAGRAVYWRRDLSSATAYEQSLEPNRERLRHILGVRDPRVPFQTPEVVGPVGVPAQLGRGQGFSIVRVRWPAFGGVFGEGLLLEPIRRAERTGQNGGLPQMDVIAIPDADQTPEQLVGLDVGIPAASQFARRLAESGCRVLIPALVSRDRQRRHSPDRDSGALLTHREYLYRSAFELGRHLIGYELQKILAGVDWFEKERQGGGKIGVFGYGEGGMLALYAGALDSRIDATAVSGYFDQREGMWQHPISRNVFGLLEQFGDAELASMVAPRALIVEAAQGPELELSGDGGAPAILRSPSVSAVQAELTRARALIRGLSPQPRWQLIAGGDLTFGSEPALTSFLHALSPTVTLRPLAREPRPSSSFDAAIAVERAERQIRAMDRHSQELLVESPYVRKEFMKRLDTGSLDAYQASTESYREFFYEDVVGRFKDTVLPFNARTRLVYDTERWVGYEVVLDVFPEVIAYGILCLPKDLAPGERRPVVVCQHGLEGRPQDIIQGDHRAYHDFAAKLAERGFVTFSPQNLYIFQNRFRTLQRKANPLKKTLFSIIVPQHQQIVDWLKAQPFTDPARVAFYGLSYGGKTAMRVPSIVTDYCLSICSADFNEWVWKNASTRSPYSYVWSGEYEIFEFDLGGTFNYAEMAALIAPRPFMVERGHFDGVAPDETVGYEFAKVRNLYAARLGIPERCEIEWFVGPHTIHGKATYDFLHRHLKWPNRAPGETVGVAE